jgi:hypothetical protein
LPDILKLTIKIQHTPNQDAKSYEIFCTIPTCHASSLKSFAQQRQEEQKKQPNVPDQAKGDAPQAGVPKRDTAPSDAPKVLAWRSSGAAGAQA